MLSNANAKQCQRKCSTMLSNANVIQCQIYQVKYKECNQKEKKLGKFTAEGKSGGRQKKDKSSS